MAITDDDLRVEDILYDEASYTAFPHVISLGSHELLLSFRQAPREPDGYTSSVEVGCGRVFTVSYCKNPRGTTGVMGAVWRLP